MNSVFNIVWTVFFFMSNLYVNIFHFWGCALNIFDSLVICFILVDWIHDTKYTYFFYAFLSIQYPTESPQEI